MSVEKRFIGFDLGAESGRCIVASFKDQNVSLKEIHRFTTHNIKYNKGFHWDILAIVNEIFIGLMKAGKLFGSYFEGIGIDTWGVDYVLIDPDGRVLGYPYHYRDDRTDEIMDETFKIIPKEKIYSITGIDFAQYNTLFQLIAEKKQSLNLLEIADKMLLMPDYLKFILTGKKKSEYTIASTTNLVDATTRDWSWELINTFDLPKSLFAEMVEPGSELGELLPSIANLTGLNSGIPVISTAGHDTASAVVSIPAEENNWAFLSSGTWSLMGIELNEPLLSVQALRNNFSNEGGFNGTTRFLKNIIGLWPLQECKRDWNNESKNYDYPDLSNKADEYGLANAWIDINDQRFLKPGNMPDKISDFLNESNQKNVKDIGFITRVILESLAFSYRATIEKIKEVTGKQINKLHAVGGGIQNEFLTQLSADATGLPVLAGPIEGTIVGNIGVQAIASGIAEDLNTWRKIVSNSFEPNLYEPKDTDYFINNEERYKSFIK
jgi:rhamnulokinase